MLIQARDEGVILHLLKGDMKEFVSLMVLSLQEPVELLQDGEDLGVGIDDSFSVWFNKDGKYISSGVSLGNFSKNQEYHREVTDPHNGDFKGFLTRFISYFQAYSQDRLGNRIQWAMERIEGKGKYLKEIEAPMEAPSEDYVKLSNQFK